MARILGLDLGSASVKAVLLESGLRGATVRQVLVAPTPPEGELLARLGAALDGLAASGPLSADTIVLALPGSSSAIHAVTLPFTDPKKIDATIGFEIEGQLPFELAEAQLDYQLAHTSRDSATLNVGVVRRQELAALLELLRARKLEPRVVTHPGLAAQLLLGALPAAALPERPDDAVALIDLGHERVTVAIGRPGGSVEACRIFPGGGLALSKALAAELGLDLAAAQAWKERHGAIGPAAVGPEAERAEAAFLRALVPVLRELRPTLKSYSARSRRGVARVFLTGGTARLPGLAARLEAELSLPTSELELPAELTAVRRGAGPGEPSGGPSSDDGAPRPSSAPELALAWALAKRGELSGAKAPRFNLRRGAFALRTDFDALGERLGQLAALGTLLFVLLVASHIVRNAVLERRDLQVDAALCALTQQVLGRCEKNFDVALNLLQGHESAAAVLPKRSAATLLATLAERIPDDIPLTLEQVSVDLDRMSLRCETATSKQVEDVVALLKATPCFKDVKEGKLEKSKDGAKVSFRLDIQIECPDDRAAGEG